MSSTIGESWLLDATVGYTDFQYIRLPTQQDCLNKGFPPSSCGGTS